MPEQQRSLADRLIDKLKNLRAVAFIIVIGATITFVAQSTESIDKILVALKLRPDALSLTRESQRDEFSRQLAQSAYRRLFWMRTYLARVTRGASEDEQHFAWSKHVESSEEWASRTLVFLEALDRFYGNAKSQCFETHIQPQFGSIATALADFRYAIPKEAAARKQAIDDLNRLIDDFNVELYLFIRGSLSNKEKHPTGLMACAGYTSSSGPVLGEVNIAG